MAKKTAEQRILELEARLASIEHKLENCVIHQNPMLNIKEAAEYLKFEVPTLRKLVHEKAIPFCRPGGKMIFFDVEQLDLWARSNPMGEMGGKSSE